MTDFSGAEIDGRVAVPGDADWDQARARLEPRGRPAPRGGRLRRERRRRRRDGPLRRRATGCGSPAREPATAPRRCRRWTARSCSRPSACAGSRSTPRRAPPGSRPASSRSSWPRRPASTGSASLPGSSPDVGVIGYTLGGGLSWLGRQLRLRLQQRHRDRAGHRRGRAADRRRRRTTPTSSGRCAAAAAATRSSPPCTWRCCRSPRSTPAS